MVQLRSRLMVADNSGVKMVRRIQVMGMKHRAGKIGRLVVASVMKANPTCTMKKGDLVRGYLVNSAFGLSRRSGFHQSFDSNSIILVNKKLEPMSNRVMVPLPKELRRLGRAKRMTIGTVSV